MIHRIMIQILVLILAYLIILLREIMAPMASHLVEGQRIKDNGDKSQKDKIIKMAHRPSHPVGEEEEKIRTLSKFQAIKAAKMAHRPSHPVGEEEEITKVTNLNLLVNQDQNWDQLIIKIIKIMKIIKILKLVMMIMSIILLLVQLIHFLLPQVALVQQTTELKPP